MSFLNILDAEIRLLKPLGEGAHLAAALRLSNDCCRGTTDTVGSRWAVSRTLQGIARLLCFAGTSAKKAFEGLVVRVSPASLVSLPTGEKLAHCHFKFMVLHLPTFDIIE